LAAVSTGIFQPAFFAAVDRAGAGLATLVALGAAPALTGVFAHYLQREPLRASWFGGTACALVGCALLLLPSGTGRADALGITFALLASTCYGGYTVAAKQLLQAERPVEGVIAASLLGGAAFLLPSLAIGAAPLLTSRGMLLVAWLGLASTALAYALFVRGLRGIHAATAGTLSLAEPLVAVAAATLFLGERLHGLELLGAAFLVAGLVSASITTFGRSRARELVLETTAQ
jgi:DME family drug/metabolite transporter